MDALKEGKFITVRCFPVVRPGSSTNRGSYICGATELASSIGLWRVSGTRKGFARVAQSNKPLGVEHCLVGDTVLWERRLDHLSEFSAERKDQSTKPNATMINALCSEFVLLLLLLELNDRYNTKWDTLTTLAIDTTRKAYAASKHELGIWQSGVGYIASQHLRPRTGAKARYLNGGFSICISLPRRRDDCGFCGPVSHDQQLN